MANNKVTNAVNKLFAKIGDGFKRVPVPVVDIAEALAFRVHVLIPENIEEEYVSGIVMYDKHTIYVNENDSFERQRFTIAHEIGHIVLEHNVGKGKEHIDTRMKIHDPIESDIREIEANQFAAELIMPEDEVRDFWNDVKDIRRCAKYFACSFTAMESRLTNLRLIKKVVYEI